MHRMLIVSLLAAGVFAMGWPASAETKNTGTRVHNQEITVKKTTDAASPSIAKKKGATKGNTVNFGDIKGESIDKDHKDW